MCIRDRNVGRGGADLTLPAAHDAADGQVTGRVGDEDGVGSVSYTHLRAHETVLDLVCRLLLEKKTEINTGQDISLGTDCCASTTTT